MTPASVFPSSPYTVAPMTIERALLFWRFGITLLAAACILAGCESTVALEPEFDPVLQLDATFTAGDPLPQIRVRRSFPIAGADVIDVPDEELWARGADVRLTRNGTPVALAEHAPGRFRAVSGEAPVQPDDTFAVEVHWEQLTARAVAVVPVLDAERIRLSVGGAVRMQHDVVLRDMRDGTRDTLHAYGMHARLALPGPPAVTHVQLVTASELELEARYGNVSGLVPSRNLEGYESFYREGEPDSLIYSKPVFTYVDEGEGPPGAVEVRAVVVVPEPIYCDYMRTGSSMFTPVTVTNVEGGVGLFIGAARDTLTARVPLRIG